MHFLQNYGIHRKPMTVSVQTGLSGLALRRCSRAPAALTTRIHRSPRPPRMLTASCSCRGRFLCALAPRLVRPYAPAQHPFPLRCPTSLTLSLRRSSSRARCCASPCRRTCWAASSTEAASYPPRILCARHRPARGGPRRGERRKTEQGRRAEQEPSSLVSAPPRCIQALPPPRFSAARRCPCGARSRGAAPRLGSAAQLPGSRAPPRGEDGLLCLGRISACRVRCMSCIWDLQHPAFGMQATPHLVSETHAPSFGRRCAAHARRRAAGKTRGVSAGRCAPPPFARRGLISNILRFCA
jgi:hypothetical protein